MIRKILATLTLGGLIAIPLVAFQNCAQSVPEDISNPSTLSTCTDLQILESGECVDKEITCELENGNGLKKYLGNGAYGPCKLAVCDPSYHENNGACEPDLQNCQLPGGGTGGRLWNPLKNAYGPCVALNCPIGQHVENQVCKPDVRACDIDNGKGQQRWNPTTNSYGKCEAVSCNENFVKADKKCIALRTVYRLNYEDQPRYQDFLGSTEENRPLHKLLAEPAAGTLPVIVCRRVLDAGVGKKDIPIFQTRFTATCNSNEEKIRTLGYLLTEEGASGAKRPLYRCLYDYDFDFCSSASNCGEKTITIPKSFLARCNGRELRIMGYTFEP